MAKKALFPGSFDPFTKGHQDIVLKGIKLFDIVHIGIGINQNKKRYFSSTFIEKKINELFISFKNIEVSIYEGLTAKFAEKIEADFILRGLRNTTDFEYENSILQANRYISKNLETIYLITSPEYAHIRSSIVQEIYNHKQNTDQFLPYRLQ